MTEAENGTPKTDAEVINHPRPGEWVKAEFSRTLERALAESERRREKAEANERAAAKQAIEWHIISGEEKDRANEAERRIGGDFDRSRIVKIILLLRAWFWEWQSFKRWERVNAFWISNDSPVVSQSLEERAKLESHMVALEQSYRNADTVSRVAWRQLREGIK